MLNKLACEDTIWFMSSYSAGSRVTVPIWSVFTYLFLVVNAHQQDMENSLLHLSHITLPAALYSVERVYFFI